jgi:hypothetical protein
MVSISTTSNEEVALTGSSKSSSKATNVISDVNYSLRIDSSSVTYEALRDVSGTLNPVEPQAQDPPERTEQHPQNATTAEPPGHPTAQMPRSTIGNGSLQTSIDQIVDRLMPFVDASRTNKENLGSYTRLSNEERMRIIEGEVIGLINDDNFAQLCEDLYGTWQRIGLGP